MLINPYLEEVLIREFMADIARDAARRHMLQALEPPPRAPGSTWMGRVLRALRAPRAARIERLVTR
jgi:hypothetical protein